MDFYSEKFMRNSFTKLEQKKIRSLSVALVGLGGTGSFAFENLVRMGVENFTLFDSDRYELTNYNRQLFAHDHSVDKLKTRVASDRAHKINRDCKIEQFGFFDPKLLKKKPNLIFDCSDNVKSKISISNYCISKKIPHVFCSANDYRGIVSILFGKKFEDMFNLPKDPDALARFAVCSSVVCPSAAVSGSLAAMMGINYILKKPIILAPDALFFNLQSKEMFWRNRLG